VSKDAAVELPTLEILANAGAEIVIVIKNAIAVMAASVAAFIGIFSIA
jgi:hypothetical protein